MGVVSRAQVGLAAGAFVLATVSASVAAPLTYGLLTTIAIPTNVGANTQPNGALTAFDISYVDPVTGNYYFADRSNASVDIFSGATQTFLGRATGFAGQLASTAISGPDGVVVVNTGSVATLYAGDGGSTLRAFNVTNPASPTPIGSVNTGGGTFRVDELAYSPSTGRILAANNANTPAFANIIGTAPLAAIHTGITISGQTATGGMEQPVWDPNTGTFFVSVPTFNGSDAGGVQEFDTNGNPLRRYDFSALGVSACAPAGLALGASGNLMVGCATAGTQTVVLNPAGTGSIVTRLAAVSGSDELWYDPASGNFYVTGVNGAGDRVIDVVSDTSYSLAQQIDLTTLGVAKSVNAHSVAVDPFNGDIFVPLEGTVGTATNTLCPNGCVAVFAPQSVPEPASSGTLLAALAGMIGIGGLVRRLPRQG